MYEHIQKFKVLLLLTPSLNSSNGTRGKIIFYHNLSIHAINLIWLAVFALLAVHIFYGTGFNPFAPHTLASTRPQPGEVQTSSEVCVTFPVVLFTHN